MNLLRALKKSYFSLSLSIRATLWFTFCNFLLQGISFITVPIFSRLLSTEEYGQMSLYATYQQFLLIIATFEYSSGTYQRGLIKHSNDILFFTKAVQLLSTINVLITFFVCLIFYHQLMNIFELPLDLLVIMFIYFLLQPSYQAWMNKKRFEYDYRSAVIMTLVYSVTSTATALIVVWKISNSASAKMIATLIMQIVVCAPFYLKNANYTPLFIEKDKTLRYFREALQLQIPLVLHSLSYLILGQSDRFMIGQMTTKTDVAVYSVAYSIAMVVTIFQQSINLVLRPWRYKKLEQGKYADLKKNTNTLLILFGIIVILFILAAPEVIYLLFDPVYYEAIWVIPCVSLSVFFILLYSIFTDVETYFGKTVYIAAVSIFCALLNILLNYFGIKIFGYMACAYTTLICYMLFSILHFVFMRKIIGRENCKKAFSGKFIFTVSLVMCLIVSGILMVYSYRLIRLGVLGIILLLCMCNWKKFKDIFNDIRN